MSFSGRTVPQLFLGEQPIAGNYELVDKITDAVGGTATLFVRSRSGEFVRVSTNGQMLLCTKEVILFMGIIADVPRLL